MDENTTQPVNPTDDQTVNTPIEGAATEESTEETPVVAGKETNDEVAPEATTDEAAN